MASTNEEEERLKAEIAKLTGAIQTHKQQHQYAPRGRAGYGAGAGASYRGGYGRGGFAGRGRGRGAVAAPLRNRTLILNDSANKNAGPSSSSAATTSTTANNPGTPDTPSNSNADGWIKRKTTHNMSLVSTSAFERTEPRRLAALEAKRKAAAAAASTSTSASSRKPRKSANKSVRRGDNMGEVVIDGVVFEFDPSGTKLVKKPVQPPASTSSTSANPQPTPSTSGGTPAAVPLKTSINGQDYIRTKRGNLISASLLAKRKAQREASAKMSRLDRMVGQISAIQSTRNAAAASRSKTLDVRKAATLCTFFNRTGQCKRGLSCPYVHDSSKLALCPRVLRPGGCRSAKGTCALSHTVKPERVPHCVHYLRSGKCRNGEGCLYTHAELEEGERTRICRSFSDYGWCDRGRQCEQRHTYECPDFVESGKCERKACKLVHVIRAQAADGGEVVEDEQLFMRDDVAAIEDAEETDRKRKRPLMEAEVEPVLPEEEEEEEDEQVDFTNADESRGAKRRKAKAFTQQRDFISFDDDEDEDGEESEDQDEASPDEDEVDDEDVASVHSEDFELSDGEAEEEEGEDGEDAGEHEDGAEAEDGEEDDEGANEDDAHPHAHQQQASDDEDDDLVDRDL